MPVNAQFHEELRQFMDTYVHRVYDYTQDFPIEERYGVISQLRRAALSVILNYIEGYARQGTNEFKHFMKVSYGSLKESKYLIHFSYKRACLPQEGYTELLSYAERIGKMEWGTLARLK